eukprot:TRINITY_DN1052_c0_g2_i1.p7 TRINITY_DN1052_c0_g2~~TRINITY_DN1052_c0_g2_i1.p7  ORF type:complete len:108 (-),score=19.94 TRINITY_DN1052_c0_g2_i1:496-819(-)
MPQKTLFNKVKKKIQKQKPKSASRHGKTPKTKQGNLIRAPKKAALIAAFKESKQLTAFVNSKNEGTAAQKVVNDGSKFGIFKAPPPIIATAQQRQEKKEKKLVKDDF